MRVTVCELPSDPAPFSEAWPDLVAHCRQASTELLLLPEMPFAPWLASTPEVDPARWEAAVAAHAAWEGRLAEPGAPTVLSTRPVVRDGRRHNEAFVWEQGTVHPAHLKYYLPDEEGFWEATWYERGDKTFDPVGGSQTLLGFLVCTEVWFTEHARSYGRQGVTILPTPRATEWATRDRWLRAGSVAAIMGGAFSISSNRGGTDDTGLRWGGLGWIIDPSGEVLATTSQDSPFATVDVDLALAEAARATYPRYVLE